MPELPYFPFYGSDWLGDSKVRRMSLEARAVHIDLLCHAWDLGYVPSDKEECAQMLGVPRRKLEALWPKVAPCWEGAGERLTNPRLEKERTKQQAKRKGRSNG